MPQSTGMSRHAALALAGLVLLASPARAEPHVVFGDSLSDGGNNFVRRNGVPLPPYDQRSSNGPVWVEQLAALMGHPVPAVSLRGGENYAYGGAQSGSNALHPADGTDGTDQLAQFQQAHPAADPAALYIIWLGANDLGQIARVPDISPAAAQAVMEEARDNVIRLMRDLSARGARRFLVLTVPDRGLVPRYSKAGAAIAADATAKSAALNALITPAAQAEAQRSGAELRVFDAFAAYQAVVAAPGQYGMTNATDVCWQGDTQGRGTQCATPDTYFFWDPAHPTTAGHRILAQGAAAVLRAPPLVAGR